MQKQIVKQLDGYADIVKEIKIAEKKGSNFAALKGETAACINKLHPARVPLRVSRIITETPSTGTLRLEAANGTLPPFQAGQYITLFLSIGSIRTSRPYSISSSPGRAGYWDITIRRVEKGLVSNYLLDEIKEGDLLESSGPLGNFHFNPIIHSKTMVCLAGGSGITPFMSMLREIADSDLDRGFYLFYGSKTADDIIFHAEIKRLARQFPNIKYIPVIEKPAKDAACETGFITADLIRKITGELDDKSFFICGPQAMYDFCLPDLQKLGIPVNRIRREMFGAPLNISGYPGWPMAVKPDDFFEINVKDRGVFKARADESLLVALEKNNLTIPSLCRSGECSMCRIKILTGQVFQAPGALVRKSDRQFGYVHACVSYPIEDLTILL